MKLVKILWFVVAVLSLILALFAASRIFETGEIVAGIFLTAFFIIALYYSASKYSET